MTAVAEYAGKTVEELEAEIAKAKDDTKKKVRYLKSLIKAQKEFEGS